MIDFVKLAIHSPTLAKWLLENKSFDFRSVCVEATGELYSFPKTAHLDNIKINIHESNRVEIQGSLHKLKYDGCNYTDFNYLELCECIGDLCQKLNLNPSEARLENVEFGVNVRPPFNATTFYRHVLAYKDESPGKMGKVSHIGIEFYKQQYGVKLYDKGRQYELAESILRFEVKVMRMAFLKEAGILYLSDLTNHKKLNSLFPLLIETYNNLIIDDKINLWLINKKIRRIYKKCRNPREWENFTPKQRCLCKKLFTEIVDKYGENQWRKITEKLISEKWNELLSIPPQYGNELTNFSNKEKECFNSSNIGIKCSPTNQEANLEVKGGTFFTMQTNPPTCLSCGRDISNQKKGSKFCSEKLYGREAKRCRNVDSNPRNHLRFKIKTIEGRGVLFDIKPFLYL